MVCISFLVVSNFDFSLSRMDLTIISILSQVEYVCILFIVLLIVKYVYLVFSALSYLLLAYFDKFLSDPVTKWIKNHVKNETCFHFLTGLWPRNNEKNQNSLKNGIMKVPEK